MKKVKLILVALTSLLVMAGCGAKKEGGGSSESSKKMTVLLSEEPTAENAFNNALNRWAKESGNEVETIVIPYDDQLTKFPLMLKNKDVPDMVSTTRLTRLYPEEFKDLSKDIDVSIFDEAALDIVGQDYGSDKKLALPNQYTITSYFYNKDAFEKAGLEAPTQDKLWTLDELYKNAELLQKAGGVKYGLAVDFSRARYDNFMYSNGGSMTKKSGDDFTVAINSSQNVKTLEKFVEMNQQNVLPKVIWTGGSADNPADYFKNGDVGIYLSGTWNYNMLLTDVSKFEFGVMPSPMGTESKSVIAGGAGLAIPSEAANSKLAIEFMKWLFLDEENYQTFLAEDKGISFIKGITYTPEDEKVAQDYQILQSETEHVTPAFLLDEQSGWRNYLDNEYRDFLKQAVNEELTAQEALDGFAEGLAEKSEWQMSK